jgi:hypothetical protein
MPNYNLVEYSLNKGNLNSNLNNSTITKWSILITYAWRITTASIVTLQKP